MIKFTDSYDEYEVAYDGRGQFKIDMDAYDTNQIVLTEKDLLEMLKELNSHADEYIDEKTN